MNRDAAAECLSRGHALLAAGNYADAIAMAEKSLRLDDTTSPDAGRQLIRQARSRLEPPSAADDSKFALYVLECEGGKYYVGKSSDPMGAYRRFEKHRQGTGALWTRIHKPVSMTLHPEMSKGDESKYTERLMAVHGIDNVRGSHYVEVELPEEKRRQAEAAIRCANDLCQGCGEKGHYIAMCPYPQGRPSPRKAEAKGAAPRKAKAAPPRRANTGRGGSRARSCRRCGRESHRETECYARTDVDGYELDSESEESSEELDSESEESSEDMFCERCGRDSHSREACYARTHVDGQRLRR